MHDVVIVGAGPVGATLALALAQTDLDVVALDARAPGETPRGDRSLALSHGARLVFERLGVWSALPASSLTPISAIDISQAGGFGTMRIDAREHDLPALGYVVSYRALQAALDAALARTQVAVRFGARVAHVGATAAYAAISLEDTTDALTARLAVAADGAGQRIDGIARERRDYGQVAVVAKLWTERPHGGIAYERFTPAGPIALLPEPGRYGLVWTRTPEQAQQALALSEEAFIESLRRHFGTRVSGYARVADRRSFPLVLERARPPVALRVVAIGNAAQALHPIAGQGFNLGLRDAYELAQSLIGSRRDDIGSRAMLDAYARRRSVDRRTGIAFTDALVRLFSGDALRWPRGLGLTLLDTMPPLKRAFTRAMLYGWG
ncbi:MAG TPA: FAD-dependent monooxygenase [Casimicrobiaceae bacterium]|jgi:2-octaprenyl-6-methoxyphenol hydroxylase